MIYVEYTTIQRVRTEYLDDTAAGDDTLILHLIRSVSREIDDLAQRYFYPRDETHYYDTPRTSQELYLGDDLLTVSAIVNGDGTTMSVNTDYKLYPLNEYPKQTVRVVNSSDNPWTYDASGDTEGVISVAGTWGYSKHPTESWTSVAALQAIITATAARWTVEVGTLNPGELVKVGSEYAYVVDVKPAGATTENVTVVRGINGSTAAAANTSAAVYRWEFDEIGNMATIATAAYLRLRNNPIGETVNIGGNTFVTPRDVTQFLNQKLRGLNLARVWL